MAKFKVVVRRLPPNLPEPIFWDSVAEWVSAESVAWKSFHPGKPKSRPEKPNVPSRAYIVFKSSEQVSQFSREYDGHIFRDKQGNETFAIVEFAPFQKVPQERKKQDARMGTIQQDDDFKSFLESLNASPSQTSEPEVPNIDPKTTPLLEALKAEKAAAKDAVQILSYHGHYHKAAKADRAVVKAASKATKAGTSIDIAKEEEAAVFSRKLNPDGTPAAVPKAILTKPESSSKGPGKGRGNGTEIPARIPPERPERVKKKPAQSQAPSQSGVRMTPTAAATSAGISHDATPASASVAPEPRKPAASQDGSNPRPERERKRHGANPRMFEAALAGVGGSAGARRREREAKKEKGEVPNGETSQAGTDNAPAPTPSPTTPAAILKSTSEPPVTSVATSEKKDRPNPPTRGGGPGAGKNTKRERGSKLAGPPARSGTDNGSGLAPAAPKILTRDANSQPTTAATSTQAENGSPDTKSAGPASRGSHSGRRGRGRGRGRGVGAGPANSSTDS